MITELTNPEKLAIPEEISVFRRLAPIIGLLATWGLALWAAPAHAQVNIDQGKSPAEIFSNDCGTCHKTAKGLANGNNSATLAGFLREHYTSSATQASSLAAYVLGAGSGPPPSANLKPAGDRAKATTEEAKPGESKNGESKSAAHPGRPEAPSAKLQQPADQDTKIEAEPAAVASPAVPGRKPPAGRHETRPITASRGPRQEPEAPPPTPQAAPVATPEMAPVATAPATTPAATEPLNSVPPATAALPPTAPELGSASSSASGSAPNAAAPEAGPAPNAAMSGPEAGPSTSAAAPGEATPGDGEPVPRDDIPD
jgi:hypothetical protein